MKNNNDLEPPDQGRPALKCPMCRLINPPSAMHCDCGYVFPAVPSNVGSSAHLAPDERQCHICGQIIKKQAVECWYCAKIPSSAAYKMLNSSINAAIPAWPWWLALLLSVLTKNLYFKALQSDVNGVIISFNFDLKTFAQVAAFASGFMSLISLLSTCTGSFFAVIWLIRQGYWAKKVVPSSHALGYAVTSIVLMTLSIPVNGDSGALFGLLGLFFNLAGIFSLKQTMEACFNRQFSGFLSFFLGPIYFQYHFDQIPKDRR
jgi:hypothetical protein